MHFKRISLKEFFREYAKKLNKSLSEVLELWALKKDKQPNTFTIVYSLDDIDVKKEDAGVKKSIMPIRLCLDSPNENTLSIVYEFPEDTKEEDKNAFYTHIETALTPGKPFLLLGGHGILIQLNSAYGLLHTRFEKILSNLAGLGLAPPNLTVKELIQIFEADEKDLISQPIAAQLGQSIASALGTAPATAAAVASNSYDVKEPVGKTI